MRMPSRCDSSGWVGPSPRTCVLGYFVPSLRESVLGDTRLASRAATTGNSLGRKSQEPSPNESPSRVATAESLRSSSAPTTRIHSAAASCVRYAVALRDSSGRVGWRKNHNLKATACVFSRNALTESMGVTRNLVSPSGLCCRSPLDPAADAARQRLCRPPG